jgi:two-component system, NarL family, sensor histidine kinase UhpB
MRRFFFRTGITSRLLTVVLLPAFILFVAIAYVLFNLSRNDAIADIQDRARLTSVAIAESAQYAVVSGNAKLLEVAMNRFLASDSSIAAIEVYDDVDKVIARVGDTSKARTYMSLSAPILRSVPDVDLFDQSAPSVSLEQPRQAKSPERLLRDLGSVKLIVHADALVQLRSARVLYAIGSIGVISLFCAILGIALARRVSAPLARITAALRQIQGGNFNIAIASQSAGEIGDIERTVNAIALALKRTKADVERELDVRMKAAIEARQAFEEESKSKARLIARTNKLIEEERTRLSHEIHDRLNASLVAIRHIPHRLISLVTNQSVDLNGSEAKQQIRINAEDLEKSVKAVYASARSIVKSLRPELLDTLGLEKALRQLVIDFESAHPDCAFVFEAKKHALDFSGDAAIAAYRIVQELLTNTVKHSKATHVVVSAKINLSRSAVTICVGDDGVGFVTDKPIAELGLGLIGLRERAESVEGQIRMMSKPRSTRICLDLPTKILASSRPTE